MAGTVNKVILIGHLGDEVKMHYFDEGNSIGRFSLATNDSYTNKQTGERVVTAEWHTIVVRNKLAEVCEKYLSKGDKVYCEGRIKTRQWEQEGIKRYATEIHIIDIVFLSTKKKADIINSSKTHPITPSESAIKQVEEEEKEDGNNLPF